MNNQLLEAFMDLVTHEKIFEGLRRSWCMMLARLVSKYIFVELAPQVTGRELKVENVKMFFRSFQGECTFSFFYKILRKLF
ncbi:hypothetical protein HanXRQr2_Chr02g0070761 [Helianthus annuus]|uniref:Uncharacterized protein n=1 Tax=Helianthus annuus TaxID=4232 RepID=A0A251VGR4_HELAN|nr:hypothetical protein HanXRQr2_Chr02g0070761 [Helianthus annuus]KAJ0605073.1 hypothetical protein HanHA300_Chr02g0058851 [Helianthus annuus]KAJ0777539.1 hypothetical protein HanLR1_Chr02g0061591 [Helianthus annuus]